MESVESLSVYSRQFFILEWIVVAIFTFDYIGNIIAAKNKPKYLFSFLGLADLISILPTFLGLANFTFLKSVRIVRLFRLLRLARLAKVAKVSRPEAANESDIHFLYKVNMEIYFAALFATLLFFGAMYNLLEPSVFQDIPAGMFLAAKLVVAGLSHTTPETTAGVMLTVLNRFAGLVLFGLLISVVGNAVRKFLFGSAKLVNEDKKLFN
jgi:voltage-gated potassium channel